ncbi:MAG: efflux RND transporter periplasmic adaptor subunit [Nitrospinaceae bacterium]
MKKWLVVLLIVFPLLYAGYFLVTQGEGLDGKEDIPFKTAVVKSGPLVVKISATGVVEPNFEVEVKSKASGEVLRFPFEEGDRVHKGQLLLVLDKSDEERQVAKAQADLDSALAQLKKAKISLLLQKAQYLSDLETARSRVQEARANLKEAEDKLERQRGLFREKIVSQEALDIAETSKKVNQETLIQAKALLQVAEDSVNDIAVRESEIELAEVDVKRAEIALEEAQERLAETEIYAPIDGTLIEKLVEEGQIISSGISNVSGGTALCKLADVRRLFIIADVDETDIGQVAVGQPVRIIADAYPDRSFQGKVGRIAPKGVVENSITIFKVKIEITGKGKKILKPIMSANVDIISREIKNTLYVPREAIHEKAGKTLAAVLKDGLPEEIPVTTGIQNPIHVQILSGLEKDREVLVGDWEKLLEEFRNKKDKMSTMRKILFILSRR